MVDLPVRLKLAVHTDERGKESRRSLNIGGGWFTSGAIERGLVYGTGAVAGSRLKQVH